MWWLVDITKAFCLLAFVLLSFINWTYFKWTCVVYPDTIQLDTASKGQPWYGQRKCLPWKHWKICCLAVRVVCVAFQGEREDETARRGMDQNQHASKRQSSGKCLVILLLSLACVVKTNVTQSTHTALHYTNTCTFFFLLMLSLAASLFQAFMLQIIADSMLLRYKQKCQVFIFFQAGTLAPVTYMKLMLLSYSSS